MNYVDIRLLLFVILLVARFQWLVVLEDNAQGDFAASYLKNA